MDLETPFQGWTPAIVVIVVIAVCAIALIIAFRRLGDGDES